MVAQVLEFKPRDTKLREMMEVLADCYEVLNTRYEEIVALEGEVYLLEMAFHQKLKEYADSVGEENVPKEFFDYSYLGNSE